MARGLAPHLSARAVAHLDLSDVTFTRSFAPGTLSSGSSDPSATGAFAFGSVSASSSGAGGSSSVSVHAVSVASPGGGASSYVTTTASGDAVDQVVGTGLAFGGHDWHL